jgi:hypothetical protein
MIAADLHTSDIDHGRWAAGFDSHARSSGGTSNFTIGVSGIPGAL